MNSHDGGVRVQLIGGPTVLIELAGLRLLTDPTFSPPGPQRTGAAVLTKLTGPAVDPAALGEIDAVLLSHDQHVDNLDPAGREYIATVPRVIATPDAAARLGENALAVEPWHHVQLERTGRAPVIVTGVPAHHGPDGTEASSGQVIGFVLAGEDIPTVYVSGDNASLRVVEEVAHHLGPIDVAVLFAGAARTPRIDAYVSLTSDQTARAAQMLDAHAVIPAHMEGWAHFTQGPETFRPAFERAGTADKLVLLCPGESQTWRSR